ncbi:MAG: tetratricopeptide repeat protein [Sphingomonadaceae bacterium]|uniref:tetratricopeptide repeat protein n=1 Tax=Thermaurantiacus sp. TaxID=2820283 RepID=UPI00298F2544|nr:tetratricopeptide repeat protein [Thermaurantiacus sp.]MCS6985994.1 tetratricopeptide repeat protein [Sphingomonadaceae bacterium]MDW8414790.1 tetratricopeptide repeat protein [Thermaurantiacus sp.]
MIARALARLVPLLLMAAAPADGNRASWRRGSADAALAPLSVTLVEKGRALLGRGQIDAAIDRFETALAVDPRNAEAFIGLAEAARARGLPGKAARFYREALSVDPQHRGALLGQGLAFLERGARPRAEANLERLRELCKGPCPEVTRLQAALAAPPSREARAANPPAAAPEP